MTRAEGSRHFRATLPLRPLILVAQAVGRAGRRGANGPEVRETSSLHMWDPGRVRPLIGYPAEGRFWALMPPGNRVDLDLGSANPPGTVWKIFKAIRRESPDLVHSYGPVLGDFLAVAAARLGGVPCIVTRPVMVGDLSEGTWLKGVLRLLDCYVFRKAALVLAVSKGGGQGLRDQGCPPDKIVVMHGGVDLEAFDPQQPPARVAWPGARPKLVIGMFAQMTPVKRHDLLLQALALGKERGWGGLIVGDGPLRGRWERLAAELGLSEQVVFTGFQEDTPPLYAACDLVVLPSGREGLPRTLIEARAMGLAVAASKVGGSAEAVGPGGLLVESNQVQPWYEALRRLEDPCLRTSLAAAGQEQVRREHDRQSITTQLEKVYRRVCGARDAG